MDVRSEHIMIEDIKVGVYKLRENATIPKFARDGDVCADLYTCEEVIIKPNTIELVRTGIAILLSEGFEAQIRSRSGLPLRHKVIVANGIGTVDSKYTDEVGVILLNLSNKTVVFESGTRIAQLAVRQVPVVEYNEVTEAEYKEACKFSRGGGFGSTGEKEIAELKK